MAESHVMTALVTKRAEMAGLIEHHRKEMGRLAADLEAGEARFGKVVGRAVIGAVLLVLRSHRAADIRPVHINLTRQRHFLPAHQQALPYLVQEDVRRSCGTRVKRASSCSWTPALRSEVFSDVPRRL